MFLVFSDGKKIYNEFKKKYKTHKKGFFILGPSGCGKTHFVKDDKKTDWIDGDELWFAAGAHPDEKWWLQGDDVIEAIDQKSDIITKQARDLGFWIIGASNYWLVPDAVVIPDWRVHKKYIIKRENNNYDGGAKSSDFNQVLGHRRRIVKHAKANNVKIFKSVNEAVKYLTISL